MEQRSTDVATRKRPGFRRVEKLLAALDGAEQVRILTHDNPDPDAIASGWSLRFLLEKLGVRDVEVVAGGVVSRAENRMLLDLLDPPISLVDDWTPPPTAALVVVDTNTPTRITAVPDGACLAAVIDHHEPPSNAEERPELRFRYRDIRPKVLASSSIVASYLRAAELEPGRLLATAMLYGIYTDAKGFEAKFSRVDRSAINWLTPFSDPDLFYRIEHAPLPREWYEDLLLAVRECFTYDGTGICFLPTASSPEVVGEVADLLVRCVDIERLVCFARVGDRLVFSARTSEKGGDATVLLARTLDPLRGAHGGHAHRAGGMLLLANLPSRSHDDISALLRTRWLEACGVERQRGRRLVARRDIVEGLA